MTRKMRRFKDAAMSDRGRRRKFGGQAVRDVRRKRHDTKGTLELIKDHLLAMTGTLESIDDRLAELVKIERGAVACMKVEDQLTALAAKALKFKAASRSRCT